MVFSPGLPEAGAGGYNFLALLSTRGLRLMSKQKLTFHVLPNKKANRWDIKQGKRVRLLSLETKREAAALARVLARFFSPAQIFLYGLNGRISGSRNFGVH
jgi:hypothetical protein